MTGASDDNGSSSSSITTVAKPAEFVELGRLLALLFDELKRARNVPDTHTFELHHVDCADAVMRDQAAVAAFTLRKIQLLRYLTKPGVRTRNSIVMALVADLNVTLTEYADDALRQSDQALRDLLVEGRDILNRAALAVSALRDGAVVELD